jgi:hypothetical protein
LLETTKLAQSSCVLTGGPSSIVVSGAVKSWATENMRVTGGCS